MRQLSAIAYDTCTPVGLQDVSKKISLQNVHVGLLKLTRSSVIADGPRDALCHAVEIWLTAAKL